MAGSRSAWRRPPQRAEQFAEVQDEVGERHDRAEVVERAGHVGAADQVEDGLRPVGVVELQRHAGDDEQQEARHDHEVQEALERRESRELLVVGLHLDLGLAERLGVVQEEVDERKSQKSVCSPKKANMPISSAVMKRNTLCSTG